MLLFCLLSNPTDVKITPLRVCVKATCESKWVQAAELKDQ